MQKKARIAIVGAGSRGCMCFAELLSRRGDKCEIVAVCDKNPVRARLAAEKYHIPHTYNELDAMLEAEKPDGLVITTPDAFHVEHAMCALAHGVNILVDKPLATTVTDCRKIIAAAEKSQKTVMIGFNLRHAPVLKKIKSLIDAGVIGRIFQIENREFYEGGRTYMGRWNRDTKNCGGLWIHKGSHDFDIFNWLLDFPQPRKVSAFAGISVLTPENLPFKPEENIPPGPSCGKCHYCAVCPDVCTYDDPAWGEEAQQHDHYVKDTCIYLSAKDVHDNGCAMVEYANGIRATHMECFITPVSERFYTIIGTEGQIEAELGNMTVTVRKRWTHEVQTYTIQPSCGSHAGADPNLVDNFLAVIRGEKSNTTTAAQAIFATAIGQAAELARRENRVVDMRELLGDTE